MPEGSEILERFTRKYAGDFVLHLRSINIE